MRVNFSSLQKVMKVLIFISTFFIVTSVCAQDDVSDREAYLKQYMDEEAEVKEEVPEPSEQHAHSEEAEHPGHNQQAHPTALDNEKLNQMLQNLSPAQKQMIEKLTKGGGSTAGLGGIDFNQVLKNLDPKALRAAIENHGKEEQVAAGTPSPMGQGGQIAVPGMPNMNFKFGEMSKMVESFMPLFRSRPKEELEQLFRAKFEMMPILSYLPFSDKLPTFCANLLHHPKALPMLAKMADNKTKIAVFLGIQIAIFIFGIVLKIKSKPDSAIKAFTGMIKRIVLVNGLRIGALVVIYGQELGPAAKLFVQSVQA